MGNYWLHRIKHEWNVSKPLLEKGYLTIGWQGLMARSQRLRECITKQHGEGFKLLISELNEYRPSLWDLNRFAQFQPGDTVVVPLYDKKFAIVEVEESAKSILELPIEIVNELGDVNLSVEGLFDEKNNKIVDIGFFIKVKTPIKILLRNRAEVILQKSMRTPRINASINDSANAIIAAKQYEGPKDVYETVEKQTTDVTLYRIHLKRSSKEKRKGLIKYCLIDKPHKIAIGWSYLHTKNPNMKSGYDLSEEFKRDENGKTNRSLAYFARLKTNDLVWTRDLNGVYYLCRILEEPKAE